VDPGKIHEILSGLYPVKMNKPVLKHYINNFDITLPASTNNRENIDFVLLRRLTGLSNYYAILSLIICNSLFTDILK
jgi:hypothetical protein